MSTLKKEYKTYSKNTIQKRIYAVAGETGKNPEDIKTELARVLNITHNQLSYYLNNTSQPEIDDFFLIAQVLKCTINDLIEPEISHDNN